MSRLALHSKAKHLPLTGKKLAHICRALNMHVLSTNSQSSRTEFEQLLQESHVVSLHCPLTAKTRGLIGEKELAMMQQGALLVKNLAACCSVPIHCFDAQAILNELIASR